MSEPQQIRSRETGKRSAGATDGQGAALRPVVEIAGGDWVLVPLEDGESWVLRVADPPDAPRLALITVSERGYFSIDRPGEVRGPYVTLSEAAYPLARPDGVLLDDPGDRSAVTPPTRPSDARPRSVRTGRRRDLLLVLATVVVVAAATRSMRVGGR